MQDRTSGLRLRSYNVGMAAAQRSGEHAESWILDPVRGIRVAHPAALMGILNATPDSFSDGGRHGDAVAARATAQVMVGAGAAFLDVGGESTRPGSVAVPIDEEIRRVVPVIEAVSDLGAAVSIDTSKAAVARAAVDAGAVMINDVSAGADPAMFALVAERRCPIVLMHMQGRPATMQTAPRYDDVVDEVLAFLVARMQAATAAGIAETAIVLDPGIGFGKTIDHNLTLLRALPRLGAETGRPLLLGVSRKTFLGTLGGVADPADRDGLSHVVHAAIAGSCAILRVHDVPGAAAACRIAAALAGRAA